MLVAPDGRRYWPSFGVRSIGDIAPVRQHQFVQRSRGLIEARLAVDAPLSGAQEEALRKRVLSRLPPGLELSFAYCASIPRSASAKFEDFVSEVAAT
jgi:hypothetical protein